MADVYKFKIRLNELEDIIWRDIEITSVSSVAKLGYAILAAFESTASHLFNIRFNGFRYEIIFEEYDFNDEPTINPIKTKLNTLNLEIGDVLSMEYDYGAGWKFTIELVSVVEMKRGAGTHYPYVTDGKGKGILEDTSPYELIKAIQHTDETGKSPVAREVFSGKKIMWDYRKFNLDLCNALFKDDIWVAQCAYERFE